MVALAAGLILPPFTLVPKPLSTILNISSHKTPSIFIKSPTQNSRSLVVFAEGNNGISKDSKDSENGFSGKQDFKKDQKPILSFSWGDLLNPDPENIVAVGLTGILTWASVQVLWQLFIISLAIVLAALKYSFIAALLLFILITLL